MTTSILVAGKESANVELVKAAVAGAQIDYQVIPAPSMSLALFLTQKNQPELVLCDVQLLDGDPHTFLSELQADVELRQIPFMLLSQEPIEERKRKDLMGAGAALVLCGGISAGELFMTIQPYIDARLARKEERLVEAAE